MERISRELIMTGIRNATISFKLVDGLLSAVIGDYWFYICEENDKTEKDFEKAELADMIYKAVNEEPINSEDEEKASECLYYKAILGLSVAEDASYTSVWGSGQRVTTPCRVNTVTKEVYDIETVDIEGLENLEEEYVTINGIQHSVSEKDSRELDDEYWYS